MSRTPGPVRVRFAPSPTGFFHVGSARTALYNWLFARQQGGTFILRIEDTDTERNREEWVGGIYSALDWLGLVWDEGPYRQSQHRAHYDRAVEVLTSQGHAYWCDCTRGEVEARAEERSALSPQGGPGAKPGYDNFCRDRALGPGPGRALRFRIPPGKPVVVRDVIRGDVVFERDGIEDFVVVKASGDPLFVLANVVDDIAMGITHVIRGEDLLPTTPKGLLLWEILDGSIPPIAPGGLDIGESPVVRGMPLFAHLPMLVNEKRQKLSKRRDPVSLEQYRADGYLPEVMVGYLALLGWSPKDGREIVPLADMVGQFQLEEVNHSPAFFDVVKLTHFNAEAIRALEVDRFAAACAPWLQERGDDRRFLAIAPHIQTRVEKLSDVPAMVDFFFTDEVDFDPQSWEKAIAGFGPAREIITTVAMSCTEVAWDAASLKVVVESAGEAAGMKLAKAQAPVRVALTGRTVGPPLFESMEVLGRERVVARLEGALHRLDRVP